MDQERAGEEKIMLKLIAVIFLALSFKSANQPCSPYDYEISGGIGTTKYGYIEALTERENGKHYTGLGMEAIPSRYLSLRWIHKEAKDLNSQTINLHSPGVLRVSLIENWQHWRDPRTMVGLAIDAGTLKMNYQTNFGDRKIFECILAREFALDKNYYVEPLLQMYSSNTNEFWQLKFRFMWRR